VADSTGPILSELNSEPPKGAPPAHVELTEAPDEWHAEASVESDCGGGGLE